MGPLIVTKNERADLNGKVVVSPGALTTAELLLRQVYPDVQAARPRYDEVMPAVQRGEALRGGYGGRCVAVPGRAHCGGRT